MRSAHVCSLFVAGLLALGCSDPELKTDLDSEGPPEVNMVTVTHEGAPIGVNGSAFPETPAFCRDDGGRINREICPEESLVGAIAVVNTQPFAWRVRITFSELLNPNVETLEDRDEDDLNEGHIDTTLPVALSCGGGDIAYDGFYDPSGNDVTVPPGPALVITSVDPFPVVSGSDCEVLVNDVPVDKDGNAVPAAYRGPHAFTLAPFHAVDFSVGNFDTGIDPDEPIAVAFNAPVDPATIEGGGFVVTEVTIDDTDPDNIVVTDVGAVQADIAINAMDPMQLLVLPRSGRFADNSSFRVTLPMASGLVDALGGVISFDCSECPSDDLSVVFTTDVSNAMDAAIEDAAVDAS
jgi:hypothetical protein